MQEEFIKGMKESVKLLPLPLPLWKPGEAGSDITVRETPALYLPLWIIAIANIGLGVAPAPLVDAATRAAMYLTGGL